MRAGLFATLGRNFSRKPSIATTPPMTCMGAWSVGWRWQLHTQQGATGDTEEQQEVHLMSYDTRAELLANMDQHP